MTIEGNQRMSVDLGDQMADHTFEGIGFALSHEPVTKSRARLTF